MLYSCSSSQGNNEAAKVPAPAGVETITVSKQLLTSRLNMPGELISYQQVDLFAREASFVKEVFVDVGSEVKTGQIIAALEAPEITSRLRGAESRLKAMEAAYIASKASYERLIATSQTPGTVSPNDLEQAQARAEADQAQLESAKASVKEFQNTMAYLTIRAPFPGVITARNVNPGAYVGPAGGTREPLFVLQEQKRLRLVVSVPEAFSSYMKHGDEVTFSLRAIPQRTFTARIARMAGALDSKLRSQRVEMDVVNEDRVLLPGMIANVNLTMSGDSTMVVPATSVVSTQERVFVIRVDGDTARWVDVTVGRLSEGNREIFGELEPGDVLVKKASDEIRNGRPISVAKPL